jgi:hypothetical protein
MDRNDILVEPHHLGVPLGTSKVISEPMVRLAQTMHLCCTDTITISKWTETRFHTSYMTEESIGCVQTISELVVLSPQTVQLTCVKISAISKQTETSFQLSLVT